MSRPVKKHAFMVTERRAYAPIEGGQSLAEPFPTTDPVFFAAGWKLFWKENAGLLFQEVHYVSRRLGWD
jgi:hypothetical protein